MTTTNTKTAALAAVLGEQYDITAEYALEIAEALVRAQYYHQRREHARTRRTIGRRP